MELPVTRREVSADEFWRLRRFIQQTDEIVGWIPDVRVARLSDTPALTRLLAHLKEREEGDGVLFIAFDASGEAAAYFDVELWAEWGACKFGGAVKPQRQGKGYGAATTLAAVDWCFHELGVDRICETTGLDNARSIRLLSRIGFRKLGETVSRRPDGSERLSLIWELDRSDWRAPRLRARTNAPRGVEATASGPQSS